MDVWKCLKDGKTIYDLPLSVCYYARVSTDHELQATSIVNQVDYFINYIDRIEKWKFVGGYVDEGISGKEVKNREQFLKMIQDGKRHCFDLVLTKSVSRFARNTIDSIYYTNLLRHLGIGVMFINDNINTFYSDSEFRLTLMASIAQDELRKLSESVQFGLKQSINRGVVLGNDNLLGYRKDCGKLVVVEEEAVIVRDVFFIFSSGKYSYSEVSRMINSKYQRKFDSTSVKRILTNCKYKGYYCGGKSTVIDYKESKRKKIDKRDWIVYRDYDRVPPVVDERIWDMVQDIIEKKNKKDKEYYKYCCYERKIFCVVHGKYLIHKRKKYKNKYYHYFVCKGCCSLSGEMFDLLSRGGVVECVLVTSGEEIRLDVKYQ